MDTIIVVNELLQEGLVLFQHLVTHIGNVVEERLILHLEHKNSVKTGMRLPASKDVESRTQTSEHQITSKTFAWSC